MAVGAQHQNEHFILIGDHRIRAKMTAMVSDFRRIKKADMAWSRPSHQDLPFASNPAIALHFADSQRGRLGEASKMMSTVKMLKEFD